LAFKRPAISSIAALLGAQSKIFTSDFSDFEGPVDGPDFPEHLEMKAAMRAQTVEVFPVPGGLNIITAIIVHTYGGITYPCMRTKL
jgi:hypothetical protein